MKCNRLFGLSLVVFLGLLCGSFIINEKNNVSAVSDVTLTLDSSNYSILNSYFCNNSDSSLPNCTDYHYFKYLSNSSCSSYSFTDSQWFRFGFQSGAYTTSLDVLPIYFSSQSYYYKNLSSFYFIRSFNFSDWPSDCVMTFTLSESGSGPSGSLSITSNGTYDVTSYAEAVVEVPDTEIIIQGDYHDDLISIRNCIIVCAGVVLVLYFFYCIYRMIINTTGGRR